MITPNVHMLLYADDICIMNDSVGRLQNQLNTLSKYCSENGLLVNLSKTKVVVFRNGGRLRQNERFYFNGQKLEFVTYYKYLGIIFSSRLLWSNALSTLAAQAEKSIFMLKRMFVKIGDVPVSLSMDLFDKIVAPVLLYGAEMWGTQKREAIELVQRKFCKYILKVSYSTPNAAALGELGRLPLSVLYKMKCIKFWLNIVHDLPNVKIKNSMYKMLKGFEENGNQNWASDVKHLLYSHGFGNVWLEQGVGDIETFVCLFKQRLIDISQQNWHDEVNSNTKLALYKTYKENLVYEHYLSKNLYKKYCIALSKFRCCNHQLAVESSRYTNIPEQLRFCKFCKENGTETVENEVHFMLICPLYADIRKLHLECYIDTSYTKEDTFKYIMSREKCITNLAAFVHKGLKIHKVYQENLK